MDAFETHLQICFEGTEDWEDIIDSDEEYDFGDSWGGGNDGDDDEDRSRRPQRSAVLTLRDPEIPLTGLCRRTYSHGGRCQFNMQATILKRSS